MRRSRPRNLLALSPEIFGDVTTEKEKLEFLHGCDNVSEVTSPISYHWCEFCGKMESSMNHTLTCTYVTNVDRVNPQREQSSRPLYRNLLFINIRSTCTRSYMKCSA